MQKLGDAEVMTDMLLTFNGIGKHKSERLAAPAKRTSIIVVADNAEKLEGLSNAGTKAGRKISVLVECDTGAHRNGAHSPQQAAELAKMIDSKVGLRLASLMICPPNGGRARWNIHLF